MQTCVGSVAGLAFTGGFGSYLIGMDHQTYLNLGTTKGNNASVSPLPPQHQGSLGLRVATMSAMGSCKCCSSPLFPA